MPLIVGATQGSLETVMQVLKGANKKEFPCSFFFFFIVHVAGSLFYISLPAPKLTQG